LKAFSSLEIKFLLSLVDTWLLQLIVDAVSLIIEVEKVAKSLKESTFLEKSLSVIILGVVSILGSKLIFSFLFSLKEDKAIILKETFLKVKEAKTLLEDIITQVLEIGCIFLYQVTQENLIVRIIKSRLKFILFLFSSLFSC